MRTKFKEGQEFKLNQNLNFFLMGDWVSAKKDSKMEIYEVEDDFCQGCNDDCTECETNSIKVYFHDFENWIRFTEKEIDEIIV